MINPNRLKEILLDCLLEKQPKDEDLVVQGIRGKFAFDREKLEEHKAEIEECVKQLPGAFHKSVGGGWSFLNACMTRDNEHWGEHIHIEMLCVLGIGIGLIEWVIEDPKMWATCFPQGMPYFVILDGKFTENG